MEVAPDSQDISGDSLPPVSVGGDGGENFGKGGNDAVTMTAGTLDLGAENWVVDSGSNRNMVKSRSHFNTYTRLPNPANIQTAGVGVGTVEVGVHSGGESVPVRVHDALHVPNIQANLLFVSCFRRLLRCTLKSQRLSTEVVARRRADQRLRDTPSPVRREHKDVADRNRARRRPPKEHVSRDLLLDAEHPHVFLLDRESQALPRILGRGRARAVRRERDEQRDQGFDVLGRCERNRACG